VHDVGGGLGTIRRSLREAFLDQGGEHRRNAGAAALDRLGLLDHMSGKHLLGRASAEGGQSGEHLIRHHSERVDVAPVIGIRSGRGLFRRHICRGAERYAA
jgi:hypothetical protein